MTAKGNAFEAMLTGGHPNSLGRTVEVVEIVLADRSRLQELFDCYASEDEVVRLRVSSAFKRIFRARRDWFPGWIDAFQELVPGLGQPSAEWTLAQLHLELWDLLSEEQGRKAVAITRAQLEEGGDWIVIIQSVKLLVSAAGDDKVLGEWLRGKLRALAHDRRKSVAKNAKQALEALDGGA